MAEYRTLRMSFWNDPYIEELGAEGRLLYLYLITCPHTNNLGMLEVSTRRMAYETGLAPETVERLLSEAEAAGKLMREGTRLWLVNFVKHQTSTSPRLMQSLRGLWREVPSERLRSAMLKRYGWLCSGAGAGGSAGGSAGVGAGGSGGAGQTLSKGMPTVCACSREGEEEGEREGKKERAGRFSPPTEGEVRAYCSARGNGISAEAFVNFYASKGWKVGSAPMRDWRAAVRSWELKRRESAASGREARNEQTARRALERFEGAAAFREERT